MKIIAESYGPSNKYIIEYHYEDDECIWMGYREPFTISKDGLTLNNTSAIEVRYVAQSDNNFLASTDGKIFSIRTKKRLVTKINKKGYEVVSTRIGGRKGKCVSVRVHRAVAIAFLGLHENLVVNHIDCNKLNNDISNLEWVTHVYNMEHAAVNGLMVRGDDSYITKLLTDDRIKEIHTSELSARKLALKLNVSRAVIDNVRRGIKTTLAFKSNMSKYSEMYRPIFIDELLN